MAGYHSAIAIHPGTGYGVVVLMAGHYSDAAKLAYDTFEMFQPAIDNALSDLSEELYAGAWYDNTPLETIGKASSAKIIVENGTLYINEYILLGVDAIKRFGASDRLALRQSMRPDEFRYVAISFVYLAVCKPHFNLCHCYRIDTGIPGYNGLKHMGCYPYWNGQDIWGIRNNAAINAIYFTGMGAGRRLHVPSLSLVLKRK